MTQLSKERLEEIAGMQVKETSNGYEYVPEVYSNVRSVEIVEMARRLLAVEGQQPDEFPRILTGRAKYLREKGEIKSPELLERAAALLQGGNGIHISIPDGWKLVPIDPTKDMLRAGQSVVGFWLNTVHCYSKMLAAAPQPAPAAQPAPEALKRLRSIVADPKMLPRRKEWISGQQYSYVLLESVKAMVDDACRAAMPNHTQEG